MKPNKNPFREGEFFDATEEKHGRCSGCKDCKTVHCNGGYEFYGCFHKPYRGKRVVEIKECPKQIPEGPKEEQDGTVK